MGGKNTLKSHRSNHSHRDLHRQHGTSANNLARLVSPEIDVTTGRSDNMSKFFNAKVSGQEIRNSQSRVSLLEDSVDDNMSLPDKLRRDIHVPMPNPEEAVDYASNGNVNYWRIADNDPNQAQFEAHLESLQEQRKRNAKTSHEPGDSLVEQETFGSR